MVDNQEKIMDEMLILVDDNDICVGFDSKIQIHRRGVLHRAFSLFIFDQHGRFLLQKRAEKKYHSAGLWTNTCCGHPRQAEELACAAHRRLQEEMGFDCALNKVATLTYRAQLTNDLIEHEYDHIFIGLFHGSPVVDPAEVADWKWLTLSEITKLIKINPEKFSVWFIEIFNQTPHDELKRWSRMMSC